MLSYMEEHPNGAYIVATENGMLPPAPAGGAEASWSRPTGWPSKYMKMITLPKVRDSLRDLKYEVKVPEEIAKRATVPIERMVAIG